MVMTKQRKEKLLMEVAEQFENAASPMNHEWLCDNNVTLDECGALMDNLAAIIRGYLQAPERIQLAILACSAMPDKAMAENVVHIMDRDRLMKQLAAKS
jgi:hypothetical protein